MRTRYRQITKYRRGWAFTRDAGHTLHVVCQTCGFGYTSGKNVKGVAKYVDVYRYCPRCGKRGVLYNGYRVYDEETDTWL